MNAAIGKAITAEVYIPVDGFLHDRWSTLQLSFV